MPMQGETESKLLVYTSPQQQISFFADEPLPKRILTIRNPYDFLVKFRISSFADCSSKYIVNTPEGVIKPHHTADIVITHKAIIPRNIGVSDTVRIQISTSGLNRTSGKKDIQLTLLNSSQREKSPLPNLDTDRFQQLEADTADLTHLQQNLLAQERNTNVVISYLSIILVCIIIWSMPEVGITNSYWPESTPRLSYDVKKWAAFFLGMFLVLLLKT